MTYPIIELAEDTPTQLEQLGTKAKFWYRDKDGWHVLFKESRPGTGENWAEKICCEICGLLDIPHAEYELAVWKNRKGVVTRSFVPKGARLVLGNELLGKIIDEYKQRKRFRARQHTVRTIMAVASSASVGLPIGWSARAQVSDAAGVFVGYLMLDALVGNQDRHHENWGLIVASEMELSLAPTFDHASSLGRNETEQTRLERLATKDTGRNVFAYVRRARSALYRTPASEKPLTTLDAFMEAAKIRPAAARYWIGKLSDVSLEAFRHILGAVPDTEITQAAREFALKMLEINTGRLLESKNLKKL